MLQTTIHARGRGLHGRWWALGVTLALWASGCADTSAVPAPPAEDAVDDDMGVDTPDLGEEPEDIGQPDAEVDLPEEDMSSQELSLPQCEPSQEICDGVDNDCNGRVDEVGCACLVDRSCYLGPPQTRGVGACRDGGRVCDQSGEFFQDCGGGVLPVLELCADGIDNNCDGRSDEEACLETCEPGDVRVCYTGPGQAAGIGECFYGQQECNVEALWSECRGDRLPQVESCGDGLDNDCDGLVDVDCAEHLPLIEHVFTVGSSESKQPVDFIVAIDNSGSMTDTVGLVEDNLGLFAQRMVSSGVDFRFVMISERGTNRRNPDICVPEPLAGPDCADNERFKHINKEVSSNSALQDIASCYSNCGGQSYQEFLRPWALSQLLVVSDDDSGLSWSSFRDQMRPQLRDMMLNGVIGTRPGECVYGVGHEYLEGINETGGEALHICDRDWARVTEVIFESTLASLQASFLLEKTPVLDTLQVFVEREGELKIEQVGNWGHREVGNFVYFVPGLGPPEGAIVTVTYRTPDP